MSDNKTQKNGNLVPAKKSELIKYSHALVSRGLELAKKITLESIKDRKKREFVKSQMELLILDATKDIEKHPKHGRSYHKRGAVYIYVEQYDRAILDFTKAIEIDSEDFLSFFERGIVYGKKGHHDQAISDFIKAIEINPWGVDSCYNLLGHEWKQFDGAISDFTRVIQAKPKSAIGYYWRGNVYKNMGHIDQAISDFTKAIEINPNSVAVYCSRGAAYFKKGQYDHAISDCTKAIEINSSDDQWGESSFAKKDSTFMLPLIYCSQGRYAEAERLYKQLLTRFEEPDDLDNYLVVEVLNGLAELYSALGRYAEAERLYKRLLTIHEKKVSGPDNSDVANVLENMAKLCKNSGKENEAKKLEERAKRIRSNLYR
jgi:tetratricopeptide (TPR) repeat protein